MQENYKKIIKHYNKLYKKYGYSEKSIGWGKNRKNLRYHILCSNFNLNYKSILDFGCGFGNLISYLNCYYKNFEYTGLDINEKFLEKARKHYPKNKFKKVNAFSSNIEKKYDFIVSSGVHNTKIEDNYYFIKDTMKKFNAASNYGFAMNFLSTNVDYKEKNLFYSNPSKILKIGLLYSNNILLRHDYMPFEFTLIVFKNKKINSELNIFEDYVSKNKLP